MTCLEYEPSAVDQIFSIRLWFKNNFYATIVRTYALTLTKNKTKTSSSKSEINATDKAIIAGKFNARIGCEAKDWSYVIVTIGSCYWYYDLSANMLLTTLF